jgi:hypothetical protein
MTSFLLFLLRILNQTARYLRIVKHPDGCLFGCRKVAYNATLNSQLSTLNSQLSTVTKKKPPGYLLSPYLQMAFLPLAKVGSSVTQDEADNK